jgi:hypothetical protein
MTSGAKGRNLQNIGIIEIHHALIGDYDKAGASPGNPPIPENRDRRAALRTDIAIGCFGTGVAQSPHFIESSGIISPRFVVVSFKCRAGRAWSDDPSRV